MRRFEWDMSLDKKEYRHFADATVHRGWHHLFPVCACVILTIALSGSLAMIPSALYLVLAVLSLAFYLGFTALAGASGRKTYTAEMRERPVHYCFTEEHFTSEHPLTVGEINYAMITSLAETEEQLLLYISRNRAFVLAKAGINGGTCEEFKSFITEKTGLSWKCVSVSKRRRTRRLLAGGAVAVAFAVAIGLRGIGYINRPVTFVSEDGENTCTITLPYFMKAVEEGVRYEGNELVAHAVFYTTETMQAWLAEKQPDKPLTLDAFSTLIKVDGMPDKAAWLKDGDDERYMLYSTSKYYVCYTLHQTEDGCWLLLLTSPDERGDTYFNRFDKWRTAATYN